MQTDMLNYQIDFMRLPALVISLSLPPRRCWEETSMHIC